MSVNREVNIVAKDIDHLSDKSVAAYYSIKAGVRVDTDIKILAYTGLLICQLCRLTDDRWYLYTLWRNDTPAGREKFLYDLRAIDESAACVDVSPTISILTSSRWYPSTRSLWFAFTCFIAFLGAVDVLSEHFDKLFRAPFVGQTNPTQLDVPVGSSAPLPFSFRSNIPSGITRVFIDSVQAFDKKGNAGDGLIMSEVTATNIFPNLLAGQETLLPIISKADKPGSYTVRIDGRAECGAFRCAQKFHLRMTVSVWREYEESPLRLTFLAEDYVRVSYDVKTGKDYPRGIEGQLVILRTPNIFFDDAVDGGDIVSHRVPGADTEMGNERTSYTWRSRPLKALETITITAYLRCKKGTGLSESEWKDLLEDTQRTKTRHNSEAL